MHTAQYTKGSIILLFAIAQALEALLPIRLRIPPPRERAGDILLLAHHFASEHTVTPAALQTLERYSWPGNLTEIRSVLERATQLAGVGPIDLIHLPERLHSVVAPPPDQLPAEGVNLDQLEQAHGNKSRAAELLGLTRYTLLYRMEKCGISTPERE